MQKKFEKLFEKENIDKILNLIKNNFEKDEEDLLLENIEYFEKLCITIKTMGWIFIEEIVDIILENTKNKWWHVRQDLIILLGKTIDLFPNEYIRFDLDSIIKKLKEIFINDEDLDNRYHTIQVIGKLGLLVPNKVLQYMITQLYDPDPKIQAYSIMALTQIANKHVGEVKEILPFLTEAFEKMPKTETGFVYDILGQSIKKISEHLYEENVADFMTTEQISCPYCKEFYPARSDVCTNCGKAVAKCSICGQKLQHDVDIKECPFCKTVFHKDHLLAWITMNRTCPNCLRSLFEEDLQ